MAAASDSEQGSTPSDKHQHSSNVGLAVALAGLAALGACIAVQQFYVRRLSKPEVARLKFYRYLRERGRLES
jgi:hypothetical protein